MLKHSHTVGFAPATSATSTTPATPEVYCDSSTLVNNANGSAYYLWADQTNFGTQAHFLLGDRARFLAENNPF